jgi:hypothetical protein
MTARAFCIREAAPGDAAALLELTLAFDDETNFMLLEPGERQETAEDVAAQLQQTSTRANAIVLVAEHEGALLGYAETQGGTHRRNRHRVESSSACVRGPPAAVSEARFCTTSAPGQGDSRSTGSS